MSYNDSAILIVEDDRPTRELYQRALSARYRVFACADDIDALQIVQSHEIGAIVLEPSLPGERGWALIETLRGIPRTCQIPIVLCSTLDERKRGMLMGAAVYLLKPVLPTTLLATLAQVIGK